MGKSLDALASYMRPLAVKLLNAAYDAGIPCEVIDTDRTPDEQQTKLLQKVSWTKYSKHEPQPPEMLSEAIDVCPLELIGKKYWAPDSPLWLQLGLIGEGLGLVWGGRWTHVNNGKGDPSHFEYKHPTSRLTT